MLTAVMQTMLPARTSPGFVACLVGIEVASVHLRLRVDLRPIKVCTAVATLRRSLWPAVHSAAAVEDMARSAIIIGANSHRQPTDRDSDRSGRHGDPLGAVSETPSRPLRRMRGGHFGSRPPARRTLRQTCFSLGRLDLPELRAVAAC